LQAFRMTYPDDPFSDNIVLLDVLPLTLGIETLQKIMTPIISRNTTIPVTKVRKFTTDTDYIDSVLIKIFEGERLLTKDNYLVGSFDLTIEPCPKGLVEIIISYHVDVNGIITVKALEKKSGIEKEIHIAGNKGRLNESEIEKLVEEAKLHLTSDNLLSEKIKLHHTIANFCTNIEYNLKSDDFKLDESEYTVILNYVQETLGKLNTIAPTIWAKEDLDNILHHIKQNYELLLHKYNDKKGDVGSCELSERDRESDPIYEFKIFIDKMLLSVHTTNGLTADDYVKKIDLVNEYTNNFMEKYPDIFEINDIDKDKDKVDDHDIVFNFSETKCEGNGSLINNVNSIDPNIANLLLEIDIMMAKLIL